MRLLVIISSVVLSACGTTRTRYIRPPADVPGAYLHADASAKASVDHWWRRFNDSNLDALVDEALKQNNDLALAAMNVRVAQLQVHLVVSNPVVTAGYTYNYSTPLKRPVITTPDNQFHSLMALMSYQVDLWDQLDALKDVAVWEARATEQDRQSVALVLIGTAVSLYLEIANLNQRVASGKESIRYAERTLQLVRVVKDAGETTTLEIAEAERGLEAQKATQADLIERRVEARNALRILLGGTPWPETQERLAVSEGVPPPVAAGLPTSLLDRRPDLRAAEMRLRESLAQSDATRLSFYPNFSLTGSVGAASSGLSELVSNPLGSLAATLALPFIQINQAHFATALARAQYDKAEVRFRDTLLRALIEVDNALSARTQLAEEGVQLERSLQSAKTDEQLYEIRYRAGALALHFWLDAQESRRQSEIALASNRLQRLENYVALCQALGGGADHL